MLGVVLLRFQECVASCDKALLATLLPVTRNRYGNNAGSIGGGIAFAVYVRPTQVDTEPLVQFNIGYEARQEVSTFSVR
ncbi:MAG: hypothetical protein AMXMBFR84_40420 [Candidatus Hydrogenedentota bacterium]